MVGIIVRGRESPHKERQIEREVCSWVSAASALDAHWMRRTCEVQSVDMLSSSALACAPHSFLSTPTSSSSLTSHLHTAQSSQQCGGSTPILPALFSWSDTMSLIFILAAAQSEPCQEIENIKHVVLFWGEIISALWVLNILCCWSIWLQISDACIMAEVTILFPKSTH